jgi:fumarate hydratase subunit alpha
MAIDSETIRRVTAQLYERSLKKIPDDTRELLERAQRSETGDTGRRTLKIMLQSADTAQQGDELVCTDVGIPVYSIKVGTRVQFSGSVRRAITEGFAELAKNMNPPILKMVTNPLTHARSFAGKDMPLVSFDMIDDADYIEIVCAPKAMGTGRWEAIDAFVYPTHEQIERFVLDTVVRAGSQPCLPIVVGVGIGGTFDYAARLAKEAVLRPFGRTNPEPILAAMEERLLDAVNALGFGPMGTGGDSSAMAVHIDYAASHGFVPVAVCFNCWINRRTAARIYNDGRVEDLQW